MQWGVWVFFLIWLFFNISSSCTFLSYAACSKSNSPFISLSLVNFYSTFHALLCLIIHGTYSVIDLSYALIVIYLLIGLTLFWFSEEFLSNYVALLYFLSTNSSIFFLFNVGFVISMPESMVATHESTLIIAKFY